MMIRRLLPTCSFPARGSLSILHPGSVVGISQATKWNDGMRSFAQGPVREKRYPLYEKIRQSPGNENTAEKVLKAVKEIDRLLDIMEPGTLALSFNGGKDACAVMHLVREACSLHRTHKFTHVQPIWFKNPTDEFPQLISFVQQQAAQFFTHPGQVRSMDGKPLSRLWTLHIANEKDFISGISKIQRQVPLRCIIMGTRRTDPGCAKLSALTASTGNYPPFLRFNPILEWSYRDVWDFIISCELPYCSLYDEGFTSLGTVNDTIRNPALRIQPKGAKAETQGDPRSKDLVPFLALAHNVPGADELSLIMVVAVC
eukprot:765034-Hanusia_phi.AAC.2